MKITNKKNYRKNGFTLIEVILYVALVSSLVIAAVTFAWNVIYGRIKSHTQQEVSQNIRASMQRIAFDIRNAQAAIVSTNSLCLVMPNTTYNPTRFYVSSGQLWVGWGGGSATCATTTNAQPLTSTEVVVNSLTFTDLGPSTALSENIKFTLSVSSKNPQNQSEWDLTKIYTSSSEVRRSFP